MTPPVDHGGQGDEGGVDGLVPGAGVPKNENIVNVLHHLPIINFLTCE